MYDVPVLVQRACGAIPKPQKRAFRNYVSMSYSLCPILYILIIRGNSKNTRFRVKLLNHSVIYYLPNDRFLYHSLWSRLLLFHVSLLTTLLYHLHLLLNHFFHLYFITISLKSFRGWRSPTDVMVHGVVPNDENDDDGNDRQKCKP